MKRNISNFKHGEYWVAWSDLKCVARRLLLFRMRPTVPYLQAHNSHETMCDRGRQSWCGSILSFKMRRWPHINMIWQEKKTMLYVLWLMCTCLMHVSGVDPLFQNWQSDCCHSIAWMKIEAKVLKTWCLRPFISAVWYFSFAMFDSLTEVDIYCSNLWWFVEDWNHW